MEEYGLPDDFWDGFLYALRVEAQNRVIFPDLSHEAFGEVVERFSDFERFREALVFPSPFNDHYPCFDEILLRGLHSRILNLSTYRNYVSFDLSEEEARGAFEDEEFSRDYLDLAETFWKSSELHVVDLHGRRLVS